MYEYVGNIFQMCGLLPSKSACYVLCVELSCMWHCLVYYTCTRLCYRTVVCTEMTILCRMCMLLTVMQIFLIFKADCLSEGEDNQRPETTCVSQEEANSLEMTGTYVFKNCNCG